MPFPLLIFAWMLAGSVTVQITPLEGDPYAAEWTGMQEGELMLTVDGEPRQLALDAIQRVEQPSQKEASRKNLQVTLRDGSQLSVDAISLQDETAQLELRRQGILELPLSQLKRLRVRPPAAAVDAQWAALVEQAEAADRLVIRRGGDTLDSVSGVVKSIADEKIEFDLEGSPVNAPFNRLEGVLFGGNDPDSSPPGLLRLKDVSGSVWNVASLAAGDDEGTVTLTSVGGAKHSIRLDLIRSLEFAGSVQFLATKTPLSKTYQPLIAIPDSVDAALTEKWLGVRSMEDSYLVMPSKSSVSYRIDPGFSKLAAEIQIDPSVTLGGKCDVRVLLNDKQVWEESLKIGEAPQMLMLPIGDASRVTFEVDYGGDGDIGDIVHLREPRLLK